MGLASLMSLVQSIINDSLVALVNYTRATVLYLE